MTTTKEQFEFAAGTGVIRSKLAKDAMMYTGRMALPEHGQCYVDGTRFSGAAHAELEVKRASDRKVIAKLTLPSGTQMVREGTLVMYAQHGTKNFKVTATIKSGDQGPYMALRLPDVRIAAGSF